MTEAIALVAHFWKVIFGAIVGIVAWFVKSQYEKDQRKTEERFKDLENHKNNSYTQEQTEKLIDNKLELPKDKINRLESLLEILLETSRVNQERSDVRDEKLYRELNDFKQELKSEIAPMSEKVAVIQNDILHITKTINKKEDNNAK